MVQPGLALLNSSTPATNTTSSFVLLHFSVDSNTQSVQGSQRLASNRSLEWSWVRCRPSRKKVGLRDQVVPVQQNRTGQFLTKSKIEFLQLNKAADWLESSYSEMESESEAALVVPVQIQKLTDQ